MVLISRGALVTLPGTAGYYGATGLFGGASFGAGRTPRADGTGKMFPTKSSALTKTFGKMPTEPVGLATRAAIFAYVGQWVFRLADLAEVIITDWTADPLVPDTSDPRKCRDAALDIVKMLEDRNIPKRIKKFKKTQEVLGAALECIEATEDAAQASTAAWTQKAKSLKRKRVNDPAAYELESESEAESEAETEAGSEVETESENDDFMHA